MKTMGLEKWIGVIGTYAVTGSMVLTFGCSIPIINDYLVGGGREPMSWFWFALFWPLLTLYWIYPYQKLSKLVKSKKTRRMHFLKTRMSQIFNEWVECEERLLEKIEEKTSGAAEGQNVCCVIHQCRNEMFCDIDPQLSQMERYHKIFKKIDESPESYVDLSSALELARALGIPSFFALASAFMF
jgi:hypothetical protein